MKLKYLGNDSWDRPVYEDENGRIWKDLDDREGTEPSLCTSLNNAFDGEPDTPMYVMKKYEGVKVEFFPMRMIERKDRFNYMILDRMKSDCDYYLGYGNRNLNRLNSDSIQCHIQEMKDLWNGFADNEKPEWLTYNQILQYEKTMTDDVRICPICNEKLKVFAQNNKDGTPLKWEWQCKCGYTGNK